jgi:hypothetical protein
MVSVVALLCGAGIALAEFTQENAIDSIAMSYAADELSLASLAIQAGPNEYWKVVYVAPRGPAPVLIGRRDDRPDDR